jgi:LmbE family N-acetylglucosaminyl deacetylase
MKNRHKHTVERWQRYIDLYPAAFTFGNQIVGKDIAFKNNGFDDYQGHKQPLFDLGNGTQSKSIALCSPHPDDESLVGALPLRLLHENNFQVFNLAVTLGSNPARKLQRKKELEVACEMLGFHNSVVGGNLGLDDVRKRVRKDFPGPWRKKVESIVEHFDRIAPSLVFMPHKGDGHPTHTGTHLLGSDALSVYTRETKTDVLAVEYEFWHPNKSPNLLVGVGRYDLALLTAALAQHKGEVRRNPYHLWMPARMMDNLRRGWELVRGSLVRVPDFCFAELYHVSVYSHGKRKKWSMENKVFTPCQAIDCFGVKFPCRR